MAGQLTIDTLKASSGVLATQNGMTGIAKAWVSWTGSTAAIRGSFNVGSITKNATGDFTVNFTTTMPDANYSVVASTSTNGTYACAIQTNSTSSSTTSAPTTSACRVSTFAPGIAFVDCPYINVTICGN